MDVSYDSRICKRVDELVNEYLIRGSAGSAAQDCLRREFEDFVRFLPCDEATQAMHYATEQASDRAVAMHRRIFCGGAIAAAGTICGLVAMFGPQAVRPLSAMALGCYGASVYVLYRAGVESRACIAYMLFCNMMRRGSVQGSTQE